MEVIACGENVSELWYLLFAFLLVFVLWVWPAFLYQTSMGSPLCFVTCNMLKHACVSLWLSGLHLLPVCFNNFCIPVVWLLIQLRCMFLLEYQSPYLAMFSAEMSIRATSLGAWGKFRLNWPDAQVFFFYEWSFGRCGQISNHVRTLLSAPSYWSSMPESAGFFLNCRGHGTVVVNCKLHGASICPHKWWSYIGQSECGNDASAPCGKAWIYAFRV